MFKLGISWLTLSGIILTVSGQTSVPAALDRWLYTCQSQIAHCPLGYAINVENMYHSTLTDCPTQSPVIDQCHSPLLDIVVNMQRDRCSGQRTCQIYQMYGYRGPCGITTFGLVLFKCEFVGFPLHPEPTTVPTTTTTTPAPIVNTYCEPANLTCSEGHKVYVQDIKYGAKVGRCDLTTAGCCSHDASDCFQSVSDAVMNVQRRICENRTHCLSINLAGYQVFCDGQRYISSYGFVKYQCIEVPVTSTLMPTRKNIATSVTSRPTPPTTTPITISSTKTSAPTTTPATKKTAPASSTTKRSTPTTTSTTKRSAPTVTTTSRSKTTLVTKTSIPPVVTTTDNPSGNSQMEVFEKAHLVLNLARGGPLFGVLSSVLVQLGQ